MKIDVVVPMMGESIIEGVLVGWLKQPGDVVRRGEDLFTMSTDKVDADIPSPAAGVLEAILVRQGERVKVGTRVAVIETEPARRAAKSHDAGGDHRSHASTRTHSARIARHNEYGERVLSRPLVPPKASSDELDLASEQTLAASDESPNTGEALPCQESVRQSTVTKPAVELEPGWPVLVPRAVTERGHEAAEVGTSVERMREERGLRVAGVEKAQAKARQNQEESGSGRSMTMVAARIVEGYRAVPPDIVLFECDWTQAVQLLGRLEKDYLRRGIRLGLLAFLVQAVVRVLREYPQLNYSNGQEVHRDQQGVHIAIEDLTPGQGKAALIPNADELSLLGLARAIQDLAARSQSGRGHGEDALQPTFTVTNLEAYPQPCLLRFPMSRLGGTAMLSCGAVGPRVLAGNSGQIKIAQVSHLFLAYDGKRVEGPYAAAFMKSVVETIEGCDQISHE